MLPMSLKDAGGGTDSRRRGVASISSAPLPRMDVSSSSPSSLLFASSTPTSPLRFRNQSGKLSALLSTRNIFVATTALASLGLVYFIYCASTSVHLDTLQQLPPQEKLPVTNVETLPVGHVEDIPFTRKFDRDYVWIEIAIDGVSQGKISIELFKDIVPITTENFRALVTGEKGPEYSYHRSVCHRIIKGFIVQCGDFTTGKGYGGRSIYGDRFDDEPAGLKLQHSKRYLLQMANAGPNTNGSQFCFMLAPAPHLNGHHVVFGEVVHGFHIVDKIEAVASVVSDGSPLQHKVELVVGGEYIKTL